MYNFAKRIKIAGEIPQSYEMMLQDQNKDRNYTLDSSTPNLNGLLDQARKNEDSNEIHEKILETPRKEAYNSQDRTLEAALDKRDSYTIHRSKKDEHVDIKPMDALSEAFDKKKRDAFAKAEESGDTAFWDKYIGDQMISEDTKVPGNLPASGSQLPNNPERFTGFAGEPSELLPADNFSSFDKNDSVKPLVMASLKDADALLFHVYFKAASENRELNAKENKIVESISEDKKKILAQLQGFNTSKPTPKPNTNNDINEFVDDPLQAIDDTVKKPEHTVFPIGTRENPDVKNIPGMRDVDFHDGNPDVEEHHPDVDLEPLYDDYLRNVQNRHTREDHIEGQEF